MTANFDELLGPDVDHEEREHLRRAHDLLVTAGPAPELPASLAAPPDPQASPAAARRAPARRRLRLALPIAAALAAASFAGGYLAGGDGDGGFETDFVLAMSGTAAAPHASASLRVGEIDSAGNWPMELSVTGLPAGRRYELLLARGGRPAVSCGYFVVRDGRTSVHLNAPYKLRQFDGWVITRAGSREVLLRDAEA